MALIILLRLFYFTVQLILDNFWIGKLLTFLFSSLFVFVLSLTFNTAVMVSQVTHLQMMTTI